MIISEINKNELLRYLGYGGQELDPALENQISKACEEVLEVANPLVTYRENEHEIVFAATLGARVDALIRTFQIKDMALAVIADAAASTLIEQVCDEFEKQARNRCASGDAGAGEAVEANAGRESYTLSPRFSPGYGDFPLTAQREILTYLDAERQIGLTLTSGGMLNPIKSVTAIMRKINKSADASDVTIDGSATESSNISHERGCGNCELKDKCKFRK